VIPLTPDLLRRVNEAFRQRGPLLLPRFGGQRKILYLQQTAQEYYLISEAGERRRLSSWEVPQLIRSLGLLSQLTYEEAALSLTVLRFLPMCASI
jgi:hypothetical protein